MITNRVQLGIVLKQIKYLGALSDGVEAVAVVANTAAVPFDGALVNRLALPLVPHLDAVPILAHIDGRVAAVSAAGESGDGRTDRQRVAFHLDPSFPLRRGPGIASADLMEKNKEGLYFK